LLRCRRNSNPASKSVAGRRLIVAMEPRRRRSKRLIDLAALSFPRSEETK
jgi:hypothetical protein